jgi:hypothetical protein
MNIDERFWSKVDNSGGKDACWNWKSSMVVRGYGKYVPAHRFAFSLYNSRPLESFDVIRHKCDNKKCCNPKHLEEGSQTDNMRDFYERQFKNWGETSTGAKLTEKDVIEIRRRADTESHTKIAKDYGVNRRQIDRIANHQSWRRLI